MSSTTIYLCDMRLQVHGDKEGNGEGQSNLPSSNMTNFHVLFSLFMKKLIPLFFFNFDIN